MQIKTLEHASLQELTAVFNEAFSDYILPIQWTEEAARKKFKGDNIDLSLSPGYYVDGKLSGFIFHCVGTREGKPIVWNGGTGVIPSQRGQGVTHQLYQFILPALRNKGFDRTVLEVIQGNDPAIHIYKKMGFEVSRQLECYKGEVSNADLPEAIQLKKIDAVDWAEVQSFRSWQPTFQNNDPKIVLLREEMEVLGAYKADNLVGYIIYYKNPEAGDIFQFAIKDAYRKRGIGKALFSSVASQKSVPLKVINVDERDAASNTFLQRIGFKKITSQFEMIKTLRTINT